MIFADENNLYIKNGSMPKMINTIGLEGVGMYLTIRSFEFENPNGVEEIKVLEASADGIEENRKQ